MIPSYRIAIYLLGGALVLSWAAPPKGMMTGLMALLLIVAAALLEHFLITRQSAKAPEKQPNVISMASYQAGRNKRHNAGTAVREKKLLHTVFTSPFQKEVDALASMLRQEGMNPMMVSRKTEAALENTIYEIRVPEKEVDQAKPLILLHQIKSADKPS